MIAETYSSFIGKYLKKLIFAARNAGLAGDEIFERAKLCEIDGMLYGAIAANIITPEELYLDNEKVEQLLRQYRVTQTARIALWFNGLKKVLCTMGDIPCILLKGMPLSQIFHGELFWRNTHDIDLWMPRNQYRGAVSRLEKLGYWCDIQPHEWATNQIHLAHKILPSVEIHWKMAPPPWITPSFEYAYKRSVKYEFQGGSVCILNASDMWINLLIHAQQHFYAPKTILDLYGCFEQLKPDMELLDAYGLEPLYENMRNILLPVIDPECIVKDHYWLNKLRPYLPQMFIHKEFGRLSMGEDSKIEAIIGVLLRALSMIGLDGNMYKSRSVWTVLLYGPHRVGAFFYHISS